MTGGATFRGDGASAFGSSSDRGIGGSTENSSRTVVGAPEFSSRALVQSPYNRFKD